ncbi:MAG: PRC-barrel domain-containing protein [Alphaproteobacteria bacterium]
MRKHLALVTGSAFLLALPGLALATDGTSTGTPPAAVPQTEQGGTGTMQRDPGGERPGPGAIDNSATPSTPMTSPQANEPSAAEFDGKEVVDREGTSVGKVEAVVGDRVIVSVGGFLGIGKKTVAIPRSALSMSGIGEEAVLVTSLTEAELEAMPEYEAPDEPRG